jgi:DNA (cytosine-5)-methyltransferase 1
MPALNAQVLVGGWPCQDLSVAGQQRGLAGSNSGLFYAFVDVATKAAATTIIAENVPNLLKLNGGAVFAEVLREFQRNGYKHCSWRTINARQFGLPHNRNRVFIIASKIKSHCDTIFRKIPDLRTPKSKDNAAGFYWTGGTQSICYSRGYVPTIKVGTTLSIASPPAVHYGDVVRQLTPMEALRLQGFDPSEFEGLSAATIYKMSGNAVARPVGKFVVDGVLSELDARDPNYLESQPDLFGGLIPTTGIPSSGFFDGGSIRAVHLERPSHLADNLLDFLDQSAGQRLSQRAASGLLGRLERSKLTIPPELRAQLSSLAEGGGNEQA